MSPSLFVFASRLTNYPRFWRVEFFSQRDVTIAILSEVGFSLVLFTVISFVGVWTASRAAAYFGSKDPQKIVIDEVAGQYLALVIGGYWGFGASVTSYLDVPRRDITHLVFALNWKCLLAGFILFRVFDIWKPFPARQAESLPRGWGIMADDWIAGLYAAFGIWILRALGL